MMTTSEEALGIKSVPLREPLRQCLDEAALGLRPIADACSVEFLKRAEVDITALETGHVPLDCDVFAMDSSKKEGVSRLYNGEDGYAPIGAYLGREGWCLELREGKPHSQCEFILLKRVLSKACSLTQSKILVRLDSAHDALETRATLAGHEGVDFILKWNPRKEDQRKWAVRIFSEGEVTKPREGKRVGLLTVRFFRPC